MIIGVNTRLLLPGKLEGIGWFTYETLKRITQSHKEHQFVFFFDRPYNPEIIFSDNVTAIVAGPPTRHPVLWFYWFERVIPKLLKKYNIDLFLSPDGYSSLSTDVKTLVVMHDINFIHRPKDLPFTIRHYYNFFFEKFARKATRLATVSEYSKSDIMKSFGINANLIDVVYNGANTVYNPLSEKDKIDVRNSYSDGNEYFIFIGALHPRKNIVRLLKAFDAFKSSSNRLSIKSDIKMIIVGEKMFKSEDIKKQFSTMKSKHDVIFTGRLSAVELSKVLASALALTFVPLFEGFGIPVVEAYYSNTPVLTSNATSLPEVAGDAALLVDPFSVEEITDAMTKLAFDVQLRQQLIEKAKIQRQKFTWDKTAEKLWQCIEKASE